MMTAPTNRPPTVRQLSKAERSRIVKQLGRAVRTRRTALLMSQREVAERSGLHRNYVGAIERGEIDAAYVTLVQLSQGLDCLPSDLLALVDEDGAPPARRGRQRT